jgi:hypothetical protein
MFDVDSEDEALACGEKFGRQAECAYETATGEFLSWRFVKVESVHTIDAEQIAHGSEVFSRFLTAAEARSLLTPFD